MNHKMSGPNNILSVFTRILIVAIFFAATVFHGGTAYAKDILVVQSYRIKPYNDALKGFKRACDSKINNLGYNLLENSEDIARAVKTTQPDLILAIGLESLEKVKNIKNVPIVYLMVLNPRAVVQGAKNITGVSMAIPPEKHLAALHKALPSAKKIGLLYDPIRNSPYVKRALSSAKSYGVELVAQEVNSPKDVPGALATMKGKIDLLWILPDITVVTPETTDFLLLFSVENKIPIHIFSGKYLDMGALSSLDTDPFDMGKQAGEIAVRILSGTAVPEIAGPDAMNPVLSINLKTAKKLGIKVHPDALDKTRVIR